MTYIDLSKKFNLDKIIYFIVLSEKKSFKKASEELYITQQALSFSIQSLESELKVKLINRESKKNFLTEDGEIFLESTSKILSNFISMFNIKNISKDIETFEIYYSFIWSGESILKIVEELNKLYPNIIIKTILINPNKIIYEDFKFKSNNFIILSENTIDNNMFDCFQGNSVNFVIVGNPQKYTKKYDWNDLDYINCSFEKLPIGSEFVNWPEISYKRKIILNTTMHDIAIELCLKSFGALFFNEIMLKNHLKNNELAIISDIPFKYYSNIKPTISWVYNRYDNNLIKDTIDISKKILL